MDTLSEDGAIRSDAMVKFRHFRAFICWKARRDSRRVSNYFTSSNYCRDLLFFYTTKSITLYKIRYCLFCVRWVIL